MAISEYENRPQDAERTAVTAQIASLVAALPEQPGLAAARREGEQILSIVEPLGLPHKLGAAVRVYPLRRDGLDHRSTAAWNRAMSTGLGRNGGPTSDQTSAMSCQCPGPRF